MEYFLESRTEVQDDPFADTGTREKGEVSHTHKVFYDNDVDDGMKPIASVYRACDWPHICGPSYVAF
jgi:hypothetical protein